MKSSQRRKYTHRILLMIISAFFLMCITSGNIFAQPADWPGTEAEREAWYTDELEGIQILPGQWRPHYPWEHIAWIKPPWPTHDYISMDFPEVVRPGEERLYLSHINPPFPQKYPDLPAVPWRHIDGGIEFERTLPNGLEFGGRLTVADETTVALCIFVRNGTSEPLKDIKLQTCAFLRHSVEFGKYTRDNKFVHVQKRGWIPFDVARESGEEGGLYRLGWFAGPTAADLPVMVTKGGPVRIGGPETNRMVAFTWDEHTYSLISNPNRPCMHADAKMDDLAPGVRGEINGRLIFFEGTIEEFQQKYFSDVD